jgi:hypothetical protein
MSYYLSDLLASWTITHAADLVCDESLVHELAKCLVSFECVWSKIIDSRPFCHDQAMTRRLLAALFASPVQWARVDAEGLLQALVAANHDRTILWYHNCIRPLA